MKVLAFDTSTQILSLCLVNGEEINLFETNQGLRHAEMLLPAVSQLLDNAGMAPADLDLIVCSRGPGSFTGLRIGMTTSKGISEGSGVPVVSVDTLDALAYPFPFYNGAVVPVIDARKSRFYAALYEDGHRKTEQLDCTANDLLHLVRSHNRILLTGPGSTQLLTYWDNERTGVDRVQGPLYGTGRALADLGSRMYHKDGPDSIEQGPLYIRKSDAEINRK